MSKAASVPESLVGKSLLFYDKNMKHDDIESVSPGLRRLCRLVRAGAAAGAVAAIAAQAWVWSSADVVSRVGPLMAGMACEGVNLDGRTRALGAAVSVVPTLLWLLLAQRLWALFGLYGRGRALTAEAQRLLQQVGLVLLASALVGPLYRAALSVVLTLANPPGQRHLVLGLGGDDYLWALVSAALLAVATVMRQAVAAVDENRSFV